MKWFSAGILILSTAVLFLIGCHSPDDASPTHVVTAYINDTSWTGQNVSLSTAYITATSVGFQLYAAGPLDTVELTGVAELNVAHALHITFDKISIRRKWGVYRDSGTVKTTLDSVYCTAVGSNGTGSNELTGYCIAGGPLPCVSGAIDSVRLRVNFDVTYL